MDEDVVGDLQQGSDAPPPNPFEVAPAPCPMPHQRVASFVPQPVSLSSVLSGCLQGLMWATAGLAIVTGVLGLAAKRAFDAHVLRQPDAATEQQALFDWIDSSNAWVNAEAFVMFSWTAMFVLTVVWMYQAHKATRSLWPGQRKGSAGWTIGGWFVPLAQFVLPKLVLNEIERISRSPRRGGYVDAGWKDQSTSAIGWLSWIGVSCGVVLIVVGSLLMSDLEPSPAEMRSGYTVESIGMFSSAVGLALGAVFVRHVARRLSPTGITATP
jgi:hypothetical protein